MKYIYKEEDTQIKDILNFLDEKSHQSLGYDATVQAIKQLINQARIDELQINRNQTGFDIGWIQMTKEDVDERIAELRKNK